MSLIWHDNAWEDYLWFQANDHRLLKRINLLIRDIQCDPIHGIGKPEASVRNCLDGCRDVSIPNIAWSTE